MRTIDTGGDGGQQPAGPGVGDLRPQEVTVIIDDREQQPLDVQPLQSVRRRLVEGDYSLLGLQHVVRIERKTIAELLRKLRENPEKLDRQLQRLMAFPSRALVIEGTWFDVERSNGRDGKRGYLLHVLLRWLARGLPVIMACNHHRAGRYTARLLYSVARDYHEAARALVSQAGDVAGDSPNHHEVKDEP